MGLAAMDLYQALPESVLLRGGERWVWRDAVDVVPYRHGLFSIVAKAYPTAYAHKKRPRYGAVFHCIFAYLSLRTSQKLRMERTIPTKL